MRIDVLTLFPEIIESYLSEGVIGRAIESGRVVVKTYNIRDYTEDTHKTVDDYPYGGGSGMVIKPEPVFKAVESIMSDCIERTVILTTPGGMLFNQRMARNFYEKGKSLLIICGRYEGIDERVRAIVDVEVSAGDYVLTGGELPALIIIDATLRLVPGVLGDRDSLKDESFEWGILDYPHYTRPSVFRGMRVPDVLLSGNHEEIRKWRRKEALRKTLLNRPDLLDNIILSQEDLRFIKEIKEEL